jgi:hypothetical protein
MEAGPGVEPRWTDLQSAAWPLCQPAFPTDIRQLTHSVTHQNLERATRLELVTSTLAR